MAGLPCYFCKGLLHHLLSCPFHCYSRILRFCISGPNCRKALYRSLKICVQQAFVTVFKYLGCPFLRFSNFCGVNVWNSSLHTQKISNLLLHVTNNTIKSLFYLCLHVIPILFLVLSENDSTKILVKVKCISVISVLIEHLQSDDNGIIKKRSL